MTVTVELAALADAFRATNSGAEVLDSLQGIFRQSGGEHFLATGFPLPGRPIEPLVLRVAWPATQADRATNVDLTSDDALFRATFRSRPALVWHDGSSDALSVGDSPLLAAISGDGAHVVGIPICAFLPYQAVVLSAGRQLDTDPRSLVMLQYTCAEAFRRLFALGHLRPERPGELSARERKVVELSAAGKTANQIATILDISQRTVHAHLQNASEKLRARNKTHTVVEALRYGQITV